MGSYIADNLKVLPCTKSMACKSENRGLIHYLLM